MSMTIQDQMRAALEHLKARRLEEAERGFRAIVSAQPTHADAMHNVGVIAAQTGRHDEGFRVIENSIQLQPRNLTFRRNLAVLLTKSGRPGDAERALDVASRALKLAPGDATLMQVYAQAADAADRHREAADAWRWVAQHAAPRSASVWSNLAKAYDRLGESEPAEQAYRAALALDANNADTLRSLAALLSRVGRVGEAIPILRRALELAPQDHEARSLLGRSIGEAGDIAGGEAILRELIANDPVSATGKHYRSLARVLAGAGRTVEALEAYELHLQHHPDDADGYVSLLLTSQYVHPDDPPRQLALHERFERDYAKDVAPLPPTSPSPLAGRRLKVGYVSGDFRDHSVGQFFLPVITSHDRQRVEVHCFSNSGRTDDYTRRMRACTDGWHDVYAMDDDALARAVREQKIDVLIDLAGHTSGTRLLAFARRPAPVQLTWLGYPNTTGMSCFDGRITDAVADPPGLTDPFHTEPLLRLPDVFAVFEPIAGAPPVSPPPFEKAGHITFACVAAIAKINDAVVQSWCDVLNAAPPTSKLLLIGTAYADAGVRQRYAQRVHDLGGDPSRLQFMGRLPFAAYLQAHERIDLILDTFPFNGHTTTVQNLWMGVPVLTLAGVSHRSRMGASVLTSIGLTELIATTPTGFAARAAALAHDPSRLAALRAQMRDRMTSSPLTDKSRFARNLEDLFIAAFERRSAAAAGGASS